MSVDEITNFLSDLNLNKGKGAGGKNTNAKGKSFEELTDVQSRLNDYTRVALNKSKFGYYLQKIDDKETIFVLQGGFKLYFEKMYKIEFFRCPDEAFIVKTGNYIQIYIIEKKEQCVEGSVETKLWSGPSLKREYEIIFEQYLSDNLDSNLIFKVNYIFCLSDFLFSKFKGSNKYRILKKILDENDILTFNGNSETYFDDILTILN